MSIPAVLIAALTAIAVVSAVILVRAAWHRPRIGALVERAAIAVLIAFFGAVYSLVALDTEGGRVILSTDLARLVTRAAVVTLLALPTYWTFLYLTGRLGDKRQGRAVVKIVWARIQSWHALDVGARTRCGRITAPNAERSETLPAGRSCETCLRIVARKADR